MGQVRVNLIGIWQYGFKSPLWIITNLDPESGLALYQQRMKIEICFRDLKSLLQIDKVMNKSQANLEKILALVMLAYAVSVLVGEAIRDVLYAQVEPAAVDLWDIPPTSQNSHWHLFSGPFLLIKKRYRLPRSTLRQIVAAALRLFRQLVHGSFVRSFVPT
jgi:hypothetical protein